MTVRALPGSFAARIAAAELREAERLQDALLRLLAPPADRVGGCEPVEILLVDAACADVPDTGDAGDAVVRTVGPDCPGKPLARELTRCLLRRWFGAGAARGKWMVAGLAGVAAARAHTGPSLPECDRRTRAALEAGRSVALTGRKARRARKAAAIADDPPLPDAPDAARDGREEDADFSAAAASFVGYLLAYGGQVALRRFLAASDPDRRDAAAVAAYQQPLGVLEEAWMAALRRRPGARDAFRALLQRVRPLLRPYRARQAEIVAYTVLAAAGNFVVPFATRWLADRIKGLGHEPAAAVSGFVHHDLPLAVAVLLGAYALDSLVSLRRAYTVTWLNQRILADLQVRLFAHLQGLPHSFYDRAKIGDLMARLTTDLENVQQALGQVTNKGLYQIFTLAGGLIAFIVVAARAVPLLTAVLPLIPLFAVGFAGLRGRNKAASRELRRRVGETAARTQESLSAHAVVKAFGLERRKVGEYSARVEAQQTAKVRLAVLGAVADLGEDVVTGVAQVAILGVGGYYVAAGVLNIGDLLAALMVMKYLFGPIASLAGIAQSVQQAVGSLERIEELEQEPVAIADAPDAAALPPLSRDIRLERVTFGYPGRGDVLRDLDLTVRAGESVALVGPTGSGKSTTIGLLLRFADPSAGRVLFDGRDLRGVTLNSLRGQISVVFQDTFLFDTTIRENIRIGRPDATDDAVKEAAKKAQLHETIKALPDGYNTVVGERGVRLSGGQRQRLAIARAILRDTPILLLDEATSALDAATEAGLLDTLRQVAQGRTTISVTHRLAWAQRADRIFVLDRGELVEQGTHAELLARGGLYRRLHDEQAGAEGAAREAAAAALRSVPLLAGLGAAALEAVGRQLAPMQAAAGAEIVTQGEPGDRLYIVAHGAVEVLLDAVGGEERRLASLADGDYFGEMALVSNAPRSATVRATAPTDLLVLSREAFLALLEREPAIAESVAATAAARSAAIAAVGMTCLFEPVAAVGAAAAAGSPARQETGAGERRHPT